MATNAAREHAAYLILAAALDATSTIQQAREFIDTIDLDAARRYLSILVEMHMPQQGKCAVCGEEISPMPITTWPDKLSLAGYWWHAGTGSAECRGVPGGRATPQDPAEPGQ